MKQHVDPAGVDILAAWANTPLALVHEILKKGEFAPGPAEPVADDEKVLGEMTPLEKALYTTASAIAASNNEMVDAAMQKKEKPDMVAVVKSHINCELLENLLWACIRHRLGVYEERGQIALREGYKVIQLPSTKRSERRMGMVMIADPFMILASSMMADMASKKDK